MFIRSGGTWTQQNKLITSDGSENDYFGNWVSVDNDTVVISGYGDDSFKGSTYMFTRSGGTWTQQNKLTANDGASNDWFGYSVSVDGDTAVIGAHADDDKGSAYVFTRSGGTWTQQEKLTASDGATGDSFGYSVSVDGDTAVISAHADDDKGSNSGSAYVFSLGRNIMPPYIPVFAPLSPVSDPPGATRTFNLSINQTVNVTWQINGIVVQTNTSVTSGSYTNTSASPGIWNVSAIAQNSNGTAMQTWTWNVAIGNDQPSTLEVCPSGCAYSSIQTAINAASVGDTILVQSGTYYENVNVNKRLILRGIGMPVVNGYGTGGWITLIANEITLEGFTAVDGDGYSSNVGINLVSNNNMLIGNNASNMGYGFFLANSNNNILIGNNANSNEYEGFYLLNSNNNTLIGNNANSNKGVSGFYLHASSNNTLRRNNASNNKDNGILVNYYSNNNALGGNNVNLNKGSGFNLQASSNNTLSGNNVLNTASLLTPATRYIITFSTTLTTLISLRYILAHGTLLGNQVLTSSAAPPSAETSGQIQAARASARHARMLIVMGYATRIIRLTATISTICH